MARSVRFGERRLPPALVVGGVTLGILLLVFLQVALPYYIGPAGLVAVVLLDASLYLGLWHRGVVRKRRRANSWILSGPVDRHDLGHGKRPLNDEIVVTIALVVFVVGISLEGSTFQTASWSVSDFVLMQIGFALMLIASWMWWPYEWRFYDWRTESEKYDTTDDH